MLKEKIIIALDTESVDKAKLLIDKLGEEVIFYKIGIVLFTRVGPIFVNDLKQRGKKIFLDLKYFDIPNSMALAAIAAADLGVDIINFHCLAGQEALKYVKDKLIDHCQKNNMPVPKLFGVSVLTSFKQQEETLPVVLELGKIAKNAGLDGIICSFNELSAIKKEFGNDFQVIVPGIRMHGEALNDQQRVATPKEALKAGADYIVIGRPILQAEDPKLLIKNIINSCL